MTASRTAILLLLMTHSSNLKRDNAEKKIRFFSFFFIFLKSRSLASHRRSDVTSPVSNK